MIQKYSIHIHNICARIGILVSLGYRQLSLLCIMQQYLLEYILSIFIHNLITAIYTIFIRHTYFHLPYLFIYLSHLSHRWLHPLVEDAVAVFLAFFFLGVAVPVAASGAAFLLKSSSCSKALRLDSTLLSPGG